MRTLGLQAATSQPLGLLAFALLEPEADDSVVAWGQIGGLAKNSLYPVLNSFQAMNAATLVSN